MMNKSIIDHRPNEDDFFCCQSPEWKRPNRWAKLDHWIDKSEEYANSIVPNIEIFTCSYCGCIHPYSAYMILKDDGKVFRDTRRLKLKYLSKNQANIGFIKDSKDIVHCLRFEDKYLEDAKFYMYVWHYPMKQYFPELINLVKTKLYTKDDRPKRANGRKGKHHVR